MKDAAARKAFERAKAKLAERLTSGWLAINDWRCELIGKKHKGSLTDSEREEIQEIPHLQEIASAHQHMVDPLPHD